MWLTSCTFHKITKCLIKSSRIVTVPRNVIIFKTEPWILKCNFHQNRGLCSKLSNENSELTAQSAKEAKENQSPVQPDYSELETNEEISRQIKIILMEHAMGKETTNQMPSVLTVRDMKELLTLKYHKRKSYMYYLFKTEIHKIASKKKKQAQIERRHEELKLKIELEGDHLHYGLGKNSIFFRLYKQSLNNFYTDRLANFVMFGQPIIYDLSFEKHMNKMEIKNTADQLKEVYSINKYHQEPFNLHFAEVDKSETLYKQTSLSIGNLESSSIINVSEKSYLDSFPKEKLVYLTPDAEVMLEKYDHDAVYIIGALVDKGPSVPLTMAKAKKQGIKMAKLPLDKYLLWGVGHKSLTLNQMMTILLCMKDTNDWNKAFTAGVPRRKLANVEDFSVAQQIKKDALYKRKIQIARREERQMVSSANRGGHPYYRKNY